MAIAVPADVLPAAVSKIDSKVIADHGLSPDEYSRIQKILGRDPNIVELGMYSVLWSEHCSYKSSKNHLKKLPTQGPRVLQGPGENAGVVDVGHGLGIALKIESHNHPSAIEPYQGAATGMGGIVRDIFTMGARPIAGLNSLRFGPLDDERNRFLFSGVVAGIGGYGNCLGLPTVAGEVVFDPSYTGNPLVNAMCVGLIRLGDTSKAAAKKLDSSWAGRVFIRGLAEGVGNPVLYVGSATGRDGIHGATFASAQLDESSEEKRPSVQVGDPFTEKLLIEACLELLNTGCVVGMQDMGAAGLTSSSSEMASRAGTGMELDLAKIPVREAAITPYEIMLSESQERMLVVLKKGTEDLAFRIFKKWGLHAEVIGRVTDDRMLRLVLNGEVVAEVPARSLADDAPVYDRPAKEPSHRGAGEPFDEQVPVARNIGKIFKELIAHPTIASKRWVYRQYDHMVQTNTVVRPGEGDAAVLRIKGSPLFVAMTTDGDGRMCAVDPFEGGKHVVAEAARNLLCVGAEPVALTNCLNFGNPEKPEIFWYFVRAVEGMSEAARRLEIPVVSGNVSLYNETEGDAILPTPVIGMVGIQKALPRPLGFQKKGDHIFLVGELGSALGGSVYLQSQLGKLGRTAARVDLNREIALREFCLKTFKQKWLTSAHDVSEGGLAVTLAEAAFQKGLGASIQLPEPKSNQRDLQLDAILFGEAPGKLVISVASRNLKKVSALAKKRGVPLHTLGKVGGSRITVSQGHKKIVDVPVAQLQKLYTESIPRRMGAIR